MHEDRLLEGAQARRRLEAELLVDGRTERVVGGERIALAAGAVEGEHELLACPLAQRLLGGERLELTDALARAAEQQARRRSDPRPRRVASPPGGRPRPARTARYGTRRAQARATARARPPSRSTAVPGSPCDRAVRPSPASALKRLQVQLVAGREHESIPRGLGHQPLAAQQPCAGPIRRSGPS